MFDFPNSPSVGQVYQPAGGPSWVWDGTVWKSYQTQGEMQIARTFIPGGAAVVNYTYTKPANLRTLEFEGSAPGGSGSGAAATAASTFSGGSGGGSGAWGKRLFTAAELAASVAISIGALGAATLGAGSAGGDVTFGSIITLYGGTAGIQYANSTASNVIGNPSNIGTAPVGVMLGAPGQRGTQTIMNVSAPAGNSYIGGGGISPYGEAFPPWWTINVGGANARGYGAGGSAAANGASQSARLGGAGAPGFVMLTEYLAVAPADVPNPARQSFAMPNGGLIIPVPATAKLARVSGRVFFNSGTNSVTLTYSHDGVTFATGASDYVIGGSALFTGTGTSPGKTVPAVTNALTITPTTDSASIALLFDTEIITSKLAGHTFTMRSRAWGYNSAAANGYQDLFYSGYNNGGVNLGPATQMGAFRLNAGSVVAADSYVTVDWIY